MPSDKWQVDVVARLLKEFKWNWVAVVGSEEEYGQQAVQTFSKIAENMSVCVAYQGLIPVYTDPEPAVKTIINNIQATNVRVVVVFSLPEPTEVFFKEVSEAENYQCGTAHYISITCYWWMDYIQFSASHPIRSIPGYQEEYNSCVDCQHKLGRP